jgi:hypothetical protein
MSSNQLTGFIFDEMKWSAVACDDEFSIKKVMHHRVKNAVNHARQKSFLMYISAHLSHGIFPAVDHSQMK